MAKTPLFLHLHQSLSSSRWDQSQTTCIAANLLILYSFSLLLVKTTYCQSGLAALFGRDLKPSIKYEIIMKINSDSTHSSLVASNNGNWASTSDQLFWDMQSCLRTSGSLTISILTYFIVTNSLSVTVWSLNVSWSTVIPNGIPHSSVLAYLLPIDWPESSTLDEIPAKLSAFSIQNDTYWTYLYLELLW